MVGLVSVFLAILAVGLVSFGIYFVYLKGRPSERPSKRIGNFLVVEGIRLHYLSEGTGPDIFLLHGLGANVYCWRKLLPLLASHFRVWAIDLKGFGLSDKPFPSSYTLTSQSSLLKGFADQMGIKKVLVAGNSMGGSVAAQMALEYKDFVSGVVLINSAHDPKMFGPAVRSLGFLSKWATPAVPLVHPLATRESIRHFLPTIYGAKTYTVSEDDVLAYFEPYANGGDSYRAFLEAFRGLLNHDLTTRLKSIQSQILILWGRGDRLLPEDFGYRLHLALPKSLFFVHPTGGHHLQEEEPEWVSKHIVKFAEVVT